MSLSSSPLSWSDPALASFREGPAQISKLAPELYVQGRARELLTRLPGDGLAIVGTRRPQSRSLEHMREVLRALRGAPLIILSGLATGIDAEAHALAIEFGFRTIAILGGPLFPLYPPENESLRARIIESGGLVITEHGSGAPVYPGNFVKRNRLIAGAARAVWIVEADLRSGAMHTARWATKMERDVYATPAFPGDPSFAGNLDYLDRDLAYPLYQAQALGQTWRAIPSYVVTQRGRSRRGRGPATAQTIQSTLPAASATLRLMIERAAKLTHAQGSVTLMTLYDQLRAAGWSHANFFATLQDGIQAGVIIEQNGTIRIAARP